ncbi:hypothetical protein GCM10009720_28170 [Yaniella flava]|uniref:HTH araC/xylS-type domain-containing protein n=2 Tax=Yaniella flava TaxID=287930 RepID=A0ABP5GGW4_9MICC
MSLSAGYYKVSLQTQGHGLLIQDGREVLLEPGALAIYDTSRPYTLSFDSDFSSNILMLPHSQIAFPQEGIQELTATSLGSGRELGEMSAQMLSQAAKVVPKLTRNLGERVANNVVDLMNTLIADELLNFSAGTLSSRHREIARVKNFIDRHLSDFSLDLTTIATTHQMSVRALHYLFEGETESVTDLIRNHRIEKAKQDLADPLQQEVPVATVGRRWGFSDPAYFSRVFRKTVGISPTKYHHESGSRTPRLGPHRSSLPSISVLRATR